MEKLREQLLERIDKAKEGVSAGQAAVKQAREAVRSATTPAAKARAQKKLDANLENLGIAREGVQCLKQVLQAAKECCCDGRETCDFEYR